MSQGLSLCGAPSSGQAKAASFSHPILPAVALFSLVGFTQMTIWAKGKHRSYLKEFRDYPPLRMPIIPFLL